MRPIQRYGVLLVGGLVWTIAAGRQPLVSIDAQFLNPSAQNIINSPRPLVESETAIVLEHVRAVVSDKKARLSYVPGGPGPEVIMGPTGWPRSVRTTSGYDFGARDGRSGHVDLITLTNYTGAASQRCDGPALNGELIIEYEYRNPPDRWTVKARTRALLEPLAPLFDALAGRTRLQTGEQQQIDGRMARAFVAPFQIPPGGQGGPPAGTTQSLWIDVETLLPLRWSLSVPAVPARGTPAFSGYGLSFTYDASIELNVPDGLTTPTCIP